MGETVMYIVMNKDIKMSPGKLAAQAAHVAVKAYGYGMAQKHWADETHKWYMGSYAKIVLKASEYEIRELLNKYPIVTVQTIDEGRTEIAKGSLTAIAFVPMDKDIAPEELRGLKLL